MPDRPSLTHARRIRLVVSALAACGLVAIGVVAATGGLEQPTQDTQISVPSGPAPWDFTTPQWDAALGGDQVLDAQAYTELEAATDPAMGAEDADVRELVRDTALADLTGSGRPALAALTPDGIAPYWPAAPQSGQQAAPQCTDVTILAAAPAALPVTGSDAATLGMVSRFAKALVAFTGTCGTQTFDLANPGIRYVYAGKVGADRWVPLRYWQVPYDDAFDAIPAATEPYDWELAAVPADCAADVVVRARIAVADAFTQMCRAAAGEGVSLRAVSGFRTRAEQAALYAQAVEFYGSAEAAGKHVAYADAGVCTSKHCSGLAVTVADDPATVEWLTQTAGCVSTDGVVTAGSSCAAGATAVPNRAVWGFAAPLATSPGYLEFTLPLASDQESSLATPNCAPAGLPVANQVAAIFRCRLAREGVVGPQAEQVVAEALVVSRCESGWNPSAAAFAGRFATTEHPATGLRYTQQGVFMLSADVARAGWVRGGVDARTDTVANINAAASLWLTTRSWVQFGCATGGGFEQGPALPQYGGPALPEWAYLY